MRFTLPHDHGEARACLLIHLGPLTPTITNQTSPHFAEALGKLDGQPAPGPPENVVITPLLTSVAYSYRVITETESANMFVT
jgi:hypothetical protein